MKYIVALRNIAHNRVELITTNYDYNKGEIVYPNNLREKYPGYNENRHRVIARLPDTPENREQFMIYYKILTDTL